MAQPRPGTLEALAAAAPDQIVLVEHGTGRLLTRAAWDERAGSLAVALADRFDAGHGTRIALDFQHPVLELFESTLALAKLGAVAVHLPAPQARPRDDVLELAGTDVVLDPGQRHEDLIEGAPPGPRPVSGVRVAPVAVSTAVDPPFFHERTDDRGDRSGLAVVVGDLITRAGHRQGRSHLVAAPTWIPSTLTHANVTLLAGGPAVLLPSFDPATWLEAVAEHEIATAVLTPDMLAGILALPREVLEDCDTTSLDCVLLVGGPVARADRVAAADLFGEGEVATLYATAAAGPIAMLDPVDIAAPDGVEGAPLRGVHVTIRNESGVTLPRGTAGQVHVASPLACAEEVDTGHVGLRDDEGRLVLTRD